jgi:hypothetical protein
MRRWRCGISHRPSKRSTPSLEESLAYAGFEPDALKYPEVLAGIHSDASIDQRRRTADYLRAAALSKVPDVG